MTDNAREIQSAVDKDKKTAAEYLLCYDELLKKYLTEKKEYLSRSKGFLGRRDAPADPTAAMAMQSAMYDLGSNEYFWLRAVELVESGLSSRSRELLFYRRQANQYRLKKRGRPAWIAYTQSQMWCSESALRWQWQKIIMQTVLTYNKLRQR